MQQVRLTKGKGRTKDKERGTGKTNRQHYFEEDHIFLWGNQRLTIRQSIAIPPMGGEIEREEVKKR